MTELVLISRLRTTLKQLMTDIDEITQSIKDNLTFSHNGARLSESGKHEALRLQILISSGESIKSILQSLEVVIEPDKVERIGE